MLYATAADGKKVQATPGSRARCPLCNCLMIARCGEINAWHWAHEATEACDQWAEAESDWHYEWKRLMPTEQVEITIEKDGERHCAPIVRIDGTIVELRATYISPEDIRAREAFYAPKRMVWLFDARDAAEDGPDGPRLELRPRDDIHTFRWKHPKKHTAYAHAPALLDLGDTGVFQLRKLHLEGGPPYGGWGKLFSRADFIEWLRSSEPA